METLIIEQEENNQKSGKFQKSPAFVRASFIIGIVTLVTTVILILTAGYIGYYGGSVLLFVIYGVILALAFIGTILGGVSFRKGRYIYGIIGFIMNIIIIGAQIVAIYVLSNDF